MTERASATGANGGSSWSEWPGRRDDWTALRNSDRVLLVVVAAIGIWLLLRLM